MKSVKIFACLFVSVISYFLQNEIRWDSNRKLKWSDFRQTIPKNHAEVAVTWSGITLDTKQKNEHLIALVIYAYFDEKLSSKVKETEDLTEGILRHEQGHFDIREWYARVLRKKLIDTTLTRSYQVSIIYDKIIKDASIIEDKYDQETQHGVDSVAQYKWDTIIKNKLKEYSAYSITEFQVNIIKNK
jgi:hypothetical protein